MKKEDIYKLIGIIIGILLLFLLGLYVGRKTVKIKKITETVYIELPPIKDSLPDVKPKEENKPIDTLSILQECIKKGIYSELFSNKIDTIFTSEDTSKIVIDWATERFYTESLFDIDTVGKCKLDLKLQYNRVSSLSYTFYPIQKQTTITQTKEVIFEPYLGGGLTMGGNNTYKVFNVAPSLEVGCFIKQHWGFGAQYQYIININNTQYSSHNVTAKVLYKF